MKHRWELRSLLVGVGLALWILGFAWHLWRPSFWILDLLLIPWMALLYIGGLVMVVVGLIAERRVLPAALVIPVLIVAMMVVNPGWRIAPRTWFEVHRPLFDLALKTETGSDYYGASLPLPLRFLTSDGKSSTAQGFRFFPQWIGVPDDAGGYLHSPSRSPEGVDLYGSACEEPVDLGGGWWMCNMAGSGL